jgi:type IV pilus biogenesis protein CpaD/CtpE
LNDIQFLAMNVVGTNGYVQVYQKEDTRVMHVYVMLPDVARYIARETAKEIRKELAGLFVEVFGLTGLNIEISTRSYPDDLVDYIGLFE